MYVSLKGRSNLVTGLFITYSLIGCIAIISTFQEISFLERIRGGAVYTTEEVDAIGIRQMYIDSVYLLIYAVLAISFLAWLYRIRKNEARLDVTGTQFSAGWSVWVWFIPIMNLFRPYQIMKEAWQASDSDADVDSWNRSSVSPLLGWWWSLFVASGLIFLTIRYLTANFAQIIADSGFAYSESIAFLIGLDWALLSASTMDIGSAILAIVLVRAISARQDNRYRNQRGFLRS